jgi:hypothetical protein
MARGGKRPGAGRPVGSKDKRTLEKIEMDRQFRQRVSERFHELIDAQFDAAKGVSHMMAKDKAGKWTQVTDPKVMARCLDSGESFYKITAQNPNVFALKDIFDRMMGMPVKAVEVTGKDGAAIVLKHELAE